MKNLVPWRRKEEHNLVARNRPDSLEDLHQQMNRLLDAFFQGWSLPAPWHAGQEEPWFAPVCEVAETDNEVKVRAELPGLNEKDVEVTLEDDQLMIRGEKKQERAEKKKNYHLAECSHGRFERVIPLPAGIDQAEIKAQFKKGVLTVTLPKTEQAAGRARHIAITAGE